MGRPTIRYNRNGIRILEKNDHLSQWFRDKPDPASPKADPKPVDPKKSRLPDPENDFSRLVERTLDPWTMEKALLEKPEFAPEDERTIREKIDSYPAPESEIDLHGCTGSQAVARVEAFLRFAGGRRLSTLRIIVGKGLHSRGGAVLPDLVENFLARWKKAGLLFSFRWENRRKRRSGSIIVYL